MALIALKGFCLVVALVYILRLRFRLDQSRELIHNYEALISSEIAHGHGSKYFHRRHDVINRRRIAQR